ncbi:BCCT family transporter [Escherichia coli]
MPGQYAIVALILAFFSSPRLPLTLRSALYPIIHNTYRTYRPCGHIFAVIGTVFGVATSLGYGVLQVNAAEPPIRGAH